MYLLGKLNYRIIKSYWEQCYGKTKMEKIRYNYLKIIATKEKKTYKASKSV